MSKTYIPASLRRLVEERAQFRCEYCLLPARVSFYPHEIDHVIAEKHGGLTDETNLAFTCWRCNRHKGTDLGSFDPSTGEFSFFYHPRKHQWSEHFNFENYKIIGISPVGRTTVQIFHFNDEDRLDERQRVGEKYDS